MKGKNDDNKNKSVIDNSKKVKEGNIAEVKNTVEMSVRVKKGELWREEKKTQDLRHTKGGKSCAQTGRFFSSDSVSQTEATFDSLLMTLTKCSQWSQWIYIYDMMDSPYDALKISANDEQENMR